MTRGRDREVSRYVRQQTDQQRSYSGGSPDSTRMSVTGIHTDGRYLCKKDHWNTSILVPLRPISARLPYPGQHTVFFEDGDRSRPFLPWTVGEREAWPVLEAQILLLTADWRCHGADFSRAYSWTEAEFSLDTAAQRTGIGTWSMVRVEDRPDESSPPTGRGIHSALGTVNVGNRQLPSATSLGTRAINSLLDTAGVTRTGWAPVSLCRVGGWLYVQVESWVETYDEEEDEFTFTTALHAWSLNADRLDQTNLQTRWYRLLASNAPRVEQTDLVVCSIPNPAYDPDGGGPEPERLERVLAFVWSESDGLARVVMLDAATGAVQSGGPITLGAGGAADNLGDMAGTRLSPSRSRVFAREEWLWINTLGQIYCYRVGTSSLSLEWDSEYLGWETAGHAREVGNVVVLGLVEDALICAFEGEVGRETVTDLFRSTAKPNFGDVIPTPRTEIARGLSRRGGYMSVAAKTGAQGSRSYFDGEIPVDTLFGPVIDTYVAFEPYTYTGPAAPSGAPGSSDYWLTGALDMHFARYHRYFWQEGVPDISGGATSNVVWDEFPARGDGDSLYSDGSYPGWNATVDADRDAKRAIEGANALALASARPNGTEQIRADRLRVEYPNWGERRVTGSPGLWETGPTETLTYDSVRGPTHPGGAGTPDITWELRGPNGRQPALPDYSASPPWPAETFEEAADGFEAFGDAADYWYRDGLGHTQPGVLWEWTFYREFIFRSSSGDSWPRNRTAAPPHTLGAACVTKSGLVVCGPHSLQEYSPVTSSLQWLPLTWRAIRPDGSIAWTYTHPGTGGATFCSAGVPIALGDGVYTFVCYGSTWRLIVLSEEGELVAEVASPTNMLDAVFDGTHFISANGSIRFGPSLT